jgi:hypothetical protein
MPREPLLKSHAECVDVLIHLLNQSDSLNNWFVLTVNVSCTLLAGVAVTQTQLGSSHVLVIDLLHDFDEVGSDPSLQLSN